MYSMSYFLIVVATVVTAAASSSVIGYGACDRDDVLPLQVNPYSFPNVSTVVPLVHDYFNQGLLLCMAFNHDEAIRSFSKAASLDPDCAMAYWGIAYAYLPNINRNITEHSRLNNGRDAVNVAIECLYRRPTTTSLEVALINAMKVAYSSDRTLHNGHYYDVKYAAAMASTVALAYPTSPDALSLTVQAWMTTSAWNYYDNNGTLFSFLAKSYDMLDDANTLSANTHPLSLHLLIHLIEMLRYGPKIALINSTADHLRALFHDHQSLLGIGHLIHMPSHVYRLVGRWEDASKQNMLAITADQLYFSRCTKWPIYNSFYRHLYYSHKHNFLLSTAMMEGRFALARKIGEQIWSSNDVDIVAVSKLIPFQIAHVVWPMLSILHSGRFKDILALPRPSSPHVDYLDAFWVYAQSYAMSSLSANGTDQSLCLTAKKYADEFEFRFARNETFLSSLNAFKGGQTILLSNVSLHARLIQNCGGLTFLGNQRAASMLWKEVFRLQKALPYGEPPVLLFSAGSCLGDALLAAEEPESAILTFKADLHERPLSGYAYHGLARAYLAVDDVVKSQEAKHNYTRAWANADLPLPVGSSCY